MPQAVPVGSFPANGFNLYDMHGNAWEWVQDCYDPAYDLAPVNGSAKTDDDCLLRVLRGGAWDSGPWQLRASVRNKDVPESRRGNVGFRLARTLQP